MRILALVCFVAMGGVSTSTVAQPQSRNDVLHLINRSHDSLTILDVAPHGSDAYQPVNLGGDLRGGGGSTTVQVATGTCVHDLRMTFRNGRVAVHPGFDMCRFSGFRIPPLPRTTRPTGGANPQ